MVNTIVALSILIGSFAIIIIVGVPLAFSLLFSSILVVIMDPRLGAVIIPLRMYSGINNFVLLAVPLFMYCASLMNGIGVTKDIVNLSDVLVGRIKGGLGHINVVASMLFAGVSGSSTADTARIGSILIPPMVRQKYSKGFSAAVTAASSTIGNIIPPSASLLR